MNTLYAIDHDLNYISHDGVPGMSWHKHKFGKWQSHAVYAQGMTNPDAKEKKGLKGAVERVKTAVGDAHTRSMAKNDAMFGVIDKNPGAYNTKAYRRLTGRAARDYAATIGAGALAGAVKANVYSNRTFAKPKDMILSDKDALQQPLVFGKDGRRDPKTKATFYESAMLNGALAARAAGIKNPETVAKISDRYGQEFLDTASAIRKADIRENTVAGAIQGAAGGFLMAPVVAHAHMVKNYNDYIKRGSGTLKNTKLSDKQKQIYKNTFNEYTKKYSEQTKLNYGRVWNFDASQKTNGNSK